MTNDSPAVPEIPSLEFDQRRAALRTLYGESAVDVLDAAAALTVPEGWAVGLLIEAPTNLQLEPPDRMAIRIRVSAPDDLPGTTGHPSALITYLPIALQWHAEPMGGSPESWSAVIRSTIAEALAGCVGW